MCINFGETIVSKSDWKCKNGADKNRVLRREHPDIPSRNHTLTPTFNASWEFFLFFTWYLHLIVPLQTTRWQQRATLDHFGSSQRHRFDSSPGAPLLHVFSFLLAPFPESLYSCFNSTHLWCNNSHYLDNNSRPGRHSTNPQWWLILP